MVEGSRPRFWRPSRAAGELQRGILRASPSPISATAAARTAWAGSGTTVLRSETWKFWPASRARSQLTADTKSSGPGALVAQPEAWSKAKLLVKLAARKLGVRNLLDVISTDTSLVRGSHGLMPPTQDAGPLLISDDASIEPEFPGQLAVKDFLLSRMFPGGG